MNKAIIEVFEEQVRKNPNAVAVTDEKRSLTRKELLSLVDAIVEILPRDIKRVGVIMDHSIEMIAAILAVLKTGAAYVPVEPSFPQERTKFILDDSQVELVLTDKTLTRKSGNYPIIQVDSNLKPSGKKIKPAATAEDLAYILYTSGSTGRPKGVSVLNRNVTSYIEAFANEFKPQASDVMLQYSVCTFDIFVEEVFSALLSGMTLAIPSEETRNDLDKLLKFIEEKNVSIISGFPYLLLDLNDHAPLPSSIRLLISGGDVLRENYISNLTGDYKIYNTYGPSETTVCAAYFCCNGQTPLPDGSFPIGKAVKGSKIEILDEDLKPVKPGIIGEICISGKGVSKGYYGDRLEENKSFTEKNGKRTFRSGDLGYELPDGNIVFVNRKDAQIMVRGKRVEPMEVENVISQNEKVKKAAVRTITTEGEPRMVAYIVFDDKNARIEVLKEKISKFLPDYMIPTEFIVLEDLPVNENGKINFDAIDEEVRHNEFRTD